MQEDKKKHAHVRTCRLNKRMCGRSKAVIISTVTGQVMLAKCSAALCNLVELASASQCESRNLLDEFCMQTDSAYRC